MSPPVKVHTAQTSEEEKNIEIVKEYMKIAYSPKDNTGRDSVKHLVASDATFAAPTTFPECHTPLDYADSHAKVMTALDNLHIKSFDVLFAKGGHVLLRYAATGTHQGAPHNGIQPTHKEAHWTACAIFEVEGGKIKSFIKEWDKKSMWSQLGWMKGEEYV